MLRAIQRRGLRLAACKSGPDYIDPMFHQKVLDTPSTNLDLFFFSSETARALLRQVGEGADLTVLEGAMGFYDGIATSERASAYDLAVQTKTPAVLVLDGRGSALSLAATVKGLSGLPQSQPHPGRAPQPRQARHGPAPGGDAAAGDRAAAAGLPAAPGGLRL